MSQSNLTPTQKSTIHNCLLDLLESSSLNNPSFLPQALSSLLESQGFGIEMSGIYISSDEDAENIPEYLENGIAFEFMESHVSLPFHEAVDCILDWCKLNNVAEKSDIEPILLKLKKKYG
ncbi:hypothetical protein Q1J52_04035 [Pseudomonas lijiangensis]|uniref:hypothetical protein n=1 Tax=Pseudomonas lijiangensis TaxID=2995658 RepID=UPI001C892688|nr:hypothetical protein [Pseudomonas cichorii]MBX8583449.1 hypothetical protein [Pseudomonas cichorii]